MNARQRKLLLQRTVLKRVKAKSELEEPVELERIDVIAPVTQVTITDLNWRPAEKFQSQSRLNRSPNIGGQGDGTIFDWDGLVREIDAAGGLSHTILKVELPITPEQRDEVATPPFELYPYQIEAMKRIRAMGPNIVFEMPSRHSHSLITALRRAEQDPMFIIAAPPRSDGERPSTMSLKMMKERILPDGEFKINFETGNLSITDEPEENK